MEEAASLPLSAADKSGGDAGENKQNMEYYDSYEDLEVHRLMLDDKPRVLAYKDAIFQNKEYFKDKVVMDVGCGTGILSIFCAQAGAKKVYAIEASSVAKLAKEIIEKNGLQNIIEVIKSKVEDVVLPGDIKVDAIVSEWMGFFLLHEGMLDSVIVARDKFLKPNGKMFPQSAILYIAPCSLPKYNEDWKNYEGIDMSVFAKQLRIGKQQKPEIMLLDEANLIGAEEIVCWINVTGDTASDLDSFRLKHVVGATKDGLFQGLCLWFKCTFPGGVVLDTSPRSPPTHWKQTVIVLPEELPLEEGEPIGYDLGMMRDGGNSRRYNITVEILDDPTVDHPVPCSCYMTRCILLRTLMSSHEQHAREQDTEERKMSIGDA